jgi:parallel beta-helix repeat protein
MTVQASTSRVSFACNGSSTVFAANIQAYLATDFLVIATNIVTGISTTLVLNSDYTLVTSGTLQPPFWTLTTQTGQLTSPYSSSYALQVILNPPNTQLTQYVQGQAFPSLAIQTNMDRLTQINIRQNDGINRAIVAPDGDVNPVMTLPAAGLRKSTNLGFDSNGNVAISLQLASGTISTATLAPFLGLSQTTAEAAAGVTPVNLQYAAGNALRYGSNTTPGTTDMTAAIQAAINQSGIIGGVSAYVPSGLYLVSATLNLVTNGILYGDGSKTTLQFSNNSAHNIQGNTITDATVRDFKITVTGNGNQSYVGAVNFFVCTNGTAKNLDISGNSGCGVLLQDSISCTVQNNYFHNFNVVNANGDVGDIYLGNDTGTGNRYCVIKDNQCFGGAWHGIMMLTGLGAPSTTKNLFNVISNNRVGQHLSYGIADYSGNGSFDLFNQIIGNYVENIQGPSTVLGGSAGTGIYLAASCGDVIANNTVNNCCVQTTNATLAPAGIGINNTNNVATNAPITIVGNTVTGMTQYNGILVTSGLNSVEVSGNTVRMPSGNTTGNGIAVNATSNCNVTGNNVNNLSANAAVFLNAGAASANNSVCNNNIQSANIGIQSNGAGPFQKWQINDNNISVSVASPALNLSNFAQATISNNVMSCGATPCVSLAACTQTRMTGNSVVCSSVQYAMTISGTCTDSYIDESNYFNATGAGSTGQAVISNGGTGIFVRQLGTAAPGAGPHVVGDTVKNTAPTATGTLEFVCTTSGTPGTWTSVTIP